MEMKSICYNLEFNELAQECLILFIFIPFLLLSSFLLFPELNLSVSKDLTHVYSNRKNIVLNYSINLDVFSIAIEFLMTNELSSLFGHGEN